MKYIVIVGIVFLFSCSKKVEKGIIINELALGMCQIDGSAKEMLIDSSSDYDSLKTQSSCSNSTFPVIDFTHYSLLGLYADGQCKATFRPSVIRNDEMKSYDFKVYVKDKGLCKSAVVKMFWVIVPKLPTDYNVNYEVVEK